ncbi:MAG: hypothetical protein WAK44_07805, partial [Trebonia sp.]|uniref:hypothetical protein n=1 Tax=Trebonia sp. TaxID=2767075 RepID=UPI003BB00C56
ITPWRLCVPVLHVDTTPNTDQVYPAATEVVGNVAAALSWLLASADGAPRCARGGRRGTLRAG